MIIQGPPLPDDHFNEECHAPFIACEDHQTKCPACDGKGYWPDIGLAIPGNVDMEPCCWCDGTGRIEPIALEDYKSVARQKSKEQRR